MEKFILGVKVFMENLDMEIIMIKLVQNRLLK